MTPRHGDWYIAPLDMSGDLDENRVAPLHVCPPHDLSDAWAEAEAALPEGWMLEVVRRGAVAGDVNPWTGYTMTAKVERYEAVAAHAWAGGPTWKRIEPPEAHAEGPTPSAALRALLPVLAALRGAK